MKTHRALLALTAALLIVPAGAPVARGPVSATEPAADDPIIIQGKTVDEWLAVLKDRDPARRRQAVEVLGERAMAPSVPQAERTRLHTAVRSLAFSEKDREVCSVESVAFARDGRALVAAGETVSVNGLAQQGQVRLYDLSGEPIARRRVLTFEGNRLGLERPVDRVATCSDVAFTPDGRRAVAIAMHRLRIWDAATGFEQVAMEERGGASSGDRLAVSPDGRWLAITRPGRVAVQDIPPSRP